MTHLTDGRARPRPPSRPGREPYVLYGLLGAGGTANVYAGARAVTSNPASEVPVATLATPAPDQVAVKVLRNAWCGNDFVRRRFQFEGHVLLTVRHAHLVRAYARGALETGQPFLVLERLDGESLLHRARRTPLTYGEIGWVLERLCEGVDALHGHGVVHGDLKPSNVFITSDDDVKVLDLGSARLLTDAPTTLRHDAIAARYPGDSFAGGTLVYASPQQVRGEAADRGDDIFALGVLLYELLSGVLPFGAGAVCAWRKRRGSRPVSLRSIPGCEHIPPSLVLLVESCLREDQRDRPSSAQGVAERFSESVQSLARCLWGTTPKAPRHAASPCGMAPQASEEK